MTIYFNAKAVSKVYEYFEERKTQQLYRMHPLKEMIIAEFTDDVDKKVYYMAFSENGASYFLWHSLDEAIIGSVLNLCPINDAKVMKMIEAII